ncbi:HAD domain-containing protein [Streptomyces sp. NPDC086783]|uniref:HAD domain-containing protein n=1 Tax=Streptomyces sp. NPDC086783 TaxID=3365758 RepID=UPI00381C6C78
MPGSALRPVLFLDVDGPLIPFGGSPIPHGGGYPSFAPAPDTSAPDTNPLLARLDPVHGPKLLSLPCELVWATTWMKEANECVAPRLGLPDLPLLPWPEPSEEDERDARRGLHWKTRPILDRAAGRPFVWVDDEISERDRVHVAAHHGAPALLHRVDPRLGLTDADYRVLGDWLRGL